MTVFFTKTVCLRIPYFKSANGSLFQQKTVCSLFPKPGQRMAVTFAEDSSFRLRISQQGWQMVVSFNRRQFVPLEITNGGFLHEESSLRIPYFKSANGSLFQQKTVCSLFPKPGQ